MRVVVLILLLLLAPAAQAEFTMSLQGPAEPIAVGTSGDLIATATMDCDDPAMASALAGGSPVTVTLSMEADLDLPLSGPTELVIPADPCLADPMGNASAQATWTVGATQDAPGEQKIRVGVTGQPRGAGGVPPATSSAYAQASIEIAPFLLLDLHAEDTIFSVGGSQQQQRIPLKITNLSNSRVNVEFLGETAGQGDLVLPTQITLESAAQGGTLASLEVVAVWRSGEGRWNDLVGTITVTPVSTKDPNARGDATTVTFLMRNTDSLERTVPAPGLPTALGTLALLVARRRA